MHLNKFKTKTVLNGTCICKKRNKNNKVNVKNVAVLFHFIILAFYFLFLLYFKNKLPETITLWHYEENILHLKLKFFFLN